MRVLSTRIRQVFTFMGGSGAGIKSKIAWRRKRHTDPNCVPGISFLRARIMTVCPAIPRMADASSVVINGSSALGAVAIGLGTIVPHEGHHGLAREAPEGSKLFAGDHTKLCLIANCCGVQL
jgi:hypothetical protein